MSLDSDRRDAIEVLRRLLRRVRPWHLPEQLNFVAGLLRRGNLVIEDVAGSRPRLEIPTVDGQLDDSFEVRRIFTSDLATQFG